MGQKVFSFLVSLGPRTTVNDTKSFAFVHAGCSKVEVFELGHVLTMHEPMTGNSHIRTSNTDRARGYVAMEKRVGRNIPKTGSFASVDVTCSSIAPNSILLTITCELFRRIVQTGISATGIPASVTNISFQPDGIPSTIQF